MKKVLCTYQTGDILPKNHDFKYIFYEPSKIIIKQNLMQQVQLLCSPTGPYRKLKSLYVC